MLGTVGRKSIVWYDHAAALPENWDNPLPNGHFLKRLILEAHERAALPHLTTIYAAVMNGDAIIAQAAFQVLSLQPEHLNPIALKGWQQTAWKLFARVAHPKLLVAGQLFRHDVRTFFPADSLAPFDAFNHYRSMLKQALRRSCAQAVLVKEPLETLIPYFQHFAPEYLLLRNDSSMFLDMSVEWLTFKDYEQSLKHKYAQRLRKVRQSWAGLEIRELGVEEVWANADHLYELYRQVTNHQMVRLGLLSKNFLPELKMLYPQKLKIWAFYEGEVMIGFASAWVQEASVDMFYIGFDYARNSELQLYFNILFFAIEQTILLQKPQLILGRTALEAKARVGCRPAYLHTFLFIKNPLLRGLVARVQTRVTEDTGEWENRHPFKKDV